MKKKILTKEQEALAAKMADAVLAGLERVLPQVTLRMKYDQAVRRLEQVGPELEKGMREVDDMKREYEDLKRELRVFVDETAYRKKIREGTRRGLERARRRGMKLGGSRRAGQSKIDFNEVRRLQKRGLTQEQIAARLGCSQALVSKKLAAHKKSKLGGKNR
jgi:hypothetical protein